MRKKALYRKPTLVEYGSVYGLTKNHVKEFGPGDGFFMVDPNDPSGPPVPIHSTSAFH